MRDRHKYPAVDEENVPVYAANKRGWKRLFGRGKPAPSHSKKSVTLILDKNETHDETTQGEPHPTASHSLEQTEAPDADPHQMTDTKQTSLMLHRAILTRPALNRASALSICRRNHWVIEVSPAEWDPQPQLWKYRILVQKRQLTQKSQEQATSFTTAFCWRSLQDFVWLEQALRAEYQGALLVPLLSIALGTTETNHEVDATLLKDWLSDILNGVRGQGEVILKQPPNVIQSEAIEAFLYRNSTATDSDIDLPWKSSPEKEAREASFVESLWSKPFCQTLNLDALCAPDTTTTTPTKRKFRPVDVLRANCSSRALGDPATLQVQDSFVQYDIDQGNMSLRSELLQAELALAESWRTSGLAAMERIRLLKEEEALVAGAWKRFAISLSNLYSYEKEVELSRVGSANETNMPYRKLHKTLVDELLRILAQQKLERSSAYPVLDGMMRAFVGDLAAVGPSLQAYAEATTQLTQIQENTGNVFAQIDDASSTSHWQETIKTIWGLIEMKKQTTSTVTAATAASSTAAVESQAKAFERRVEQNETLLQESLTALLKATQLRAARMAHQFCAAESKLATFLSSAAISLRTKINVADRDVLTRIQERHRTDSKADDKTELELVERLLEIGNTKKYDPSRLAGPEGGADVGHKRHDARRDAVKAEQRKKALRLANERVGKWNSQLALAIMEAVGIDDAEVQVEETTRDLRLVRRHAIGLRENLGRCTEALQVLRSAILFGHHEGASAIPVQETIQSILESRREFANRCNIVFSGTYETARKSSKNVLQQAGIPLEDPAGWLARSRAKCGATFLAYSQARDADVDDLLHKLEQQLNDYKKRVESIESYVYMQCVGIQLEKHFSKKRAEALAAFEKKTDIQTAINLALKKRLPLLVQELETKLQAVDAVTHTTVKESKEAHLLSKSLKSEIGDLALRRFQRSKESALNAVVSLMTSWATYEEVACSKELKLLTKAMEEVETSLKFILALSSDGISQHVKPVNNSSEGIQEV